MAGQVHPERLTLLAEVQPGEVLDFVERRTQAAALGPIVERSAVMTFLEEHASMQFLGVPMARRPEQRCEEPPAGVEVALAVQRCGKREAPTRTEAGDERRRVRHGEDIVETIEREVEPELPVDVGSPGLLVGEL